MAPGGRWPRMGSGPATPVKGRPGSRGSGRSPSSEAGWLLRRPPGPFAGRPARACRQDRSVLRGVPWPVWLPPAVPSSVIGSRANLGPRLPPPTSVSFLQMRRVSPRVERCNKKPRVPTSRGRSTEPRLPPALPLLFLQLVCPGARGAGQGEGRASFTCRARNGCTREHTCTRTHMHAHTRICAHTQDTMCRAVRPRRERRVFSPWYPFPSLLAPWPVSSAGNRHPPATRPYPPFAPSAWSQLRVWPEQPSTGKPPFTGPLATHRVGFLRDDPWELEWEGGELSSRNRPQHPMGRNISAEGFPSWPLDVRAAFLFLGKLVAGHVLWPGWNSGVPPRPTFLAWEVHTSTLCSAGLVSWLELGVLTCALLPTRSNPCPLLCGAGGRPWGQSPSGGL